MKFTSASYPERGRAFPPRRRHASWARNGLACRPGRRDSEKGAVLVLALIFLVSVAVVVGALAEWTANDIDNASQFSAQRSLQLALSGTTNVAIQSIRYAPLLTNTLNASPPSYCWGNGPTSTLSNFTVRGVATPVDVWCSTAWYPNSTATRVVTFSACPETQTAGVWQSTSATTCAQNPNLQAVVSFDDYPVGDSAFTANQCVTFCGTVMTQNSWVWSPSVPVVSAVSPSSGPWSGGQPVTITGSNFVSNATVSLIAQNGGTSVVSYIAPVAATNVDVVSSSSITANVPGVTEGTVYYVTVTTPGGGTSPPGPTATYIPPTYTYNPVTPTVLTLSPVLKSPYPQNAGGSSGGGTTVTISGSGFYGTPTVNFVLVSNPSVVVSSTDVTVVNSITITALSPAVSLQGMTVTGSYTSANYYVTVTDPGGSPSAYGPVFTYFIQAPTVTGLNGSTGTHTGGTGFTVLGNGFETGDTVNFVEVSNTNVSFPATGVSVQGPTTIGATSPAVTPAGQYYVTVTSPGCTGSQIPSCTSSGGVNGPVFTTT
jgi:hypothetical protein